MSLITEAGSVNVFISSRRPDFQLCVLVWHGEEPRHLVISLLWAKLLCLELSLAKLSQNQTRQNTARQTTFFTNRIYEIKIKRAFWPGLSFRSFGEGREERNRRKQALRKDSHPAGLTPLLMFTVLLNTFFLVFSDCYVLTRPLVSPILGWVPAAFYMKSCLNHSGWALWPLLSFLFPIRLLGAAVLIGNGPTGNLC